jgi:hypothetical protein
MPTTFKFNEYLTNMEQQLKAMNAFTNKKIIYHCKDIPIFQHFNFRELTAFKYFLWMKAIISHPDFTAKNLAYKITPMHILNW